MSEAEERTEENGEGGEVKGKNKKMLIIIIAVVLLLAGGGAGLYFAGMLPFGGHAEEETAAEGEHGSDGGEHGKAAAEGGDGAAHGAAAQGEGGAAATPGGVVFYQLPEFLVNLQSTGKRASFLKMKVTLELPDAESEAKIKAMEPRIVDSFNTYLRELRSSDLAGSAGIYRLREELLLRTNKTVYPAKVNDILFNEMLVQ